jgi:hypothetical protein
LSPPLPPLCQDLIVARSTDVPHLYLLSGITVDLWAPLPPPSTSCRAASPWGALLGDIPFPPTLPLIADSMRRAGPPPPLHCLTVGVQYANEKDSENTSLRCCEMVLIELDQWSSSFVLIRFGSVLIGLCISRVDAFHLFNLMD